MASGDDRRPLRGSSAWTVWRTWVILTGLIVAVHFVGLLNRYFLSAAAGAGFSLAGQFWRELPAYLLSLPLLPIVWFLANRFPLHGRYWHRHTLLHLVAAIATSYFTILGTRLILSIEDTMQLLPDGQKLTELARTGEWQRYTAHFMIYWVWYWAIVGIFYAFSFYNESQQRLRIAAELQANLVQARLHALRCQLNPHFLFNTLNAISVLTLKGEREAVVEMLERLSDLLRLALDDSRPESITLQQELDFVSAYLAMQQVRFSDRLAVHREVEPEVLGATVPAMILQPLVENAVKHGVAACVGASTVVVHASRRGDRLQLRVSDTSPGSQVGVPRVTRTGIGLANTEARLEQLYGQAHHIEYGSDPDGLVSVTISIPFSVAGPVAFALRTHEVES